MRVLYHVTPSRNVPSILSSGLRASGTGGHGGIAEGGEHTFGVYFFKSLEEAIDHLALEYPPGPMIRAKEWTMLRVSLPSSYELFEFEEYPGLTTYYTTEDVSSSNIKVIGSLDKPSELRVSR